MSLCAKAVFCRGVERKLHRMLLPLFGNSSSKRPFSLVSHFFVGIDRTRRTRLKLPCGNVNLGLRLKCHGSVTPAAPISQTSCVWRCQTRNCHPAHMANGNLLGGTAAWPGKMGLKVTLVALVMVRSFARQLKMGQIKSAVTMYM